MIRPQLDGVPEYHPSGQPAGQEETEQRQALMWQVEWDGRAFEPLIAELFRERDCDGQ